MNIFVPADGGVQFYHYDIYGKIVGKKSIQCTKGNSQAVMDDLNRLPAAMYILRTAYNNTTLQNKLFKTN